MREKQLVNELMGPVSRHDLQIMRGNKIVEIKSPHYNKGSEIKRLLDKKDYDFVLAIGDDTTDDDMFLALPEGGISIKVGAFRQQRSFVYHGSPRLFPFWRD